MPYTIKSMEFKKKKTHSFTKSQIHDQSAVTPNSYFLNPKFAHPSTPLNPVAPHSPPPVSPSRRTHLLQSSPSRLSHPTPVLPSSLSSLLVAVAPQTTSVLCSSPSRLKQLLRHILFVLLLSFHHKTKQLLMTDNTGNSGTLLLADKTFGKLPDHLLIEIFIRVPIIQWAEIACVKKQWANLFREECLWQAALSRTFPFAGQAKRWPGPIPGGLSRRRYAALYVSKHIFSLDSEANEIVGHTYLFLKEQLELSTMPPPSGILHGTIIDQFIACGKPRDAAHELASQIWLAVLDNLEENEHTFLLLKCLAQEADVFLPYPYTKSIKVQWRVFEKLFTDFRDCFGHDYYDVLACAKNKFQPIPSTWLGY